MLGGHRVDEFIHQAGSDYTLGAIGRSGRSKRNAHMNRHQLCIKRYMIRLGLTRQQDPLIPLRSFIVAHPSSTFPVEIVLVRIVLKMTLDRNPLGHAGIIGVSHVP